MSRFLPIIVCVGTLTLLACTPQGTPPSSPANSLSINQNIQENKDVSLPGPEDSIRTFFHLIQERKLADAAMMINTDDNTRQAWAVNFNVLRSVSVKEIFPLATGKETPDQVAYKVILDVSIKPVENSYGWTNGENTRWITLQKINNMWMIHELANNP